jgi:hypothetical protein
MIPESELVSNDWQLAEDGTRPASLVIQLRRDVFVLPWFRFGYAQGTNTHAVIVFGSHTVVCEGWGFASLLAGIAGHRVVRIIEPTENEAKFGVRGDNAEKYVGPGITSIKVVEA